MAADDVEVRDRRSSDDKGSSLVAGTAIESSAAVLQELMRTAISNPLMGCILGLVLADLLKKANIITLQTSQQIKLLVLFAAGVTITADILQLVQELEGLVLGDITFGGNVNASLIKPSANTVVTGASAGDQISALLPLLIALAPK